MAGIAEQHDAPAAPAVVALAIEDRPDRHVGGHLDDAQQVGVEVVEALEQLLARAGQRSRIALPPGPGRDADDINLIAPAGHEIDEDVPVRTPPFGAVRNLVKPRSACVGKIARCAAIPMYRGGSRPSRYSRTLEFTPSAPTTISASTVTPLSNARRIASRRLVQRDQAMIECDRSGRHALLQHRMQIAAVNVGVGPAEPGLALGIELDLVHRLAGVPGPADIAVRLDSDVYDHLLEAEAAKHLHRVGAENDAGADAGEGGCLLVDGDRETRALQEARDRHPAKPGADDRNPRLPIHCRSVLT